MTCVAVHAVVYIAVHLGVLEISSVVAAMTASALKDRIVRRVCVASSADSVGVPMVQGEEGVVAGGQSSRNPGRCSMASCAGGGPASRDVIRVCGSREIRLMAGVASGGGSCKDVVDVAFDAVHGDVRAGERERSVVVIERCSGPGSRGVAGIASGWEACRCVSRIGGSVPIRRMASVTGSGQSCVVVIHVALCAGNGGMRAGEWERRVVVIERGGSPVCRRVADRAICREAAGHVIRVRSSVVIGLVAGIAGGGGGCVVVVGMALRAGHRCVGSRQSVIRIYRVIEGGDGGPVGGRVASVAGSREGNRRVIGICSSCEVGLVATVAGGRQSCVVVIGVALGALQRGMRSGQREH